MGCLSYHDVEELLVERAVETDGGAPERNKPPPLQVIAYSEHLIPTASPGLVPRDRPRVVGTGFDVVTGG
jgi:hypothetical protein